MTDITWAEVLTPIVSIGLGALAFVQATRANRSAAEVERIKVEAEAYSRAQKIYDNMVARLREDNERLIDKIAQLEIKIDRLEHALHEHGISP